MIHLPNFHRSLFSTAHTYTCAYEVYEFIEYEGGKRPPPPQKFITILAVLTVVHWIVRRIILPRGHYGFGNTFWTHIILRLCLGLVAVGLFLVGC